MSARNFIQAIGAGETIRLPQGRFFFIRSALASLDVRPLGNASSPVSLTGIGAGSKFGPVEAGQGWKYLEIFSASAQNIEVIISDDGLFDVANTVNVAGSVTTAEAPSSAVASPAPVTFATASASTIAANLTRRRITISALDTNVGSLYVQAVGSGAGRGYQLQAGMSAEFKTTAALDVRNDTGAGATYSVFEES